MKLKDRNTNDLRAKSVEDLKSSLVDLQKKLMGLRFQKANKKQIDTALLRHSKRQIARIKTIIREKGVA